MTWLAETQNSVWGECIPTPPHPTLRTIYSRKCRKGRSHAAIHFMTLSFSFQLKDLNGALAVCSCGLGRFIVCCMCFRKCCVWRKRSCPCLKAKSGSSPTTPCQTSTARTSWSSTSSTAPANTQTRYVTSTHQHHTLMSRHSGGLKITPDSLLLSLQRTRWLAMLCKLLIPTAIEDLYMISPRSCTDLGNTCEYVFSIRAGTVMKTTVRILIPPCEREPWRSSMWRGERSGLRKRLFLCTIIITSCKNPRRNLLTDRMQKKLTL